MNLVDRDNQLCELQDIFTKVEADSTGHSLFLMGEAGSGKSSLVNHFIDKLGNRASVFLGSCDSLFTPQPLGPLYDIATDLDAQLSNLLKTEKDRSAIFSFMTSKLSVASKTVILVFEDVHWAEEATLDLIKYLGRRIQKFKCLFIPKSS